MIVPVKPAQPNKRVRTQPPASRLPALPGNVLGLDLSLTCTGWCYYMTNGQIETGHITSTKKGVARLMDLRAKLKALLIRLNPSYVGVEGYSFGSKNTRAHSTGEWGGIARVELIEQQPPGAVFVASPSTVKKMITGSSNAEKAVVRLHLNNRYGLFVEHEDEADATSVAITVAAHLWRERFALTKFQEEALNGTSKTTPVCVLS